MSPELANLLSGLVGALVGGLATLAGAYWQLRGIRDSQVLAFTQQNSLLEKTFQQQLQLLEQTFSQQLRLQAADRRLAAQLTILSKLDAALNAHATEPTKIALSLSRKVGSGPLLRTSMLSSRRSSFFVAPARTRL